MIYIADGHAATIIKIPVFENVEFPGILNPVIKMYPGFCCRQKLKQGIWDFGSFSGLLQARSNRKKQTSRKSRLGSININQKLATLRHNC